MKFKVTITLQVRQTFTYEIDERNERRAEDVACDRAVDEFRISTAIANDPDDVYDIETEQLTEDCEECGLSTRLEWHISPAIPTKPPPAHGRKTRTFARSAEPKSKRKRRRKRQRKRVNRERLR